MRSVPSDSVRRDRRAPRASNEGAVVEVVRHDVERAQRTLAARGSELDAALARASDLDDAFPPESDLDEAFMRLALDEARAAEALDEVPIGAVVVLAGRVIARARNRTRGEADPTAHAELAAIRAACRAMGAQRIPGAVVYTTVEPCFMCAGALSHARVERVVWAVRDPKFGGCASLGRVLSDPRLNHRVAIREGVRADEARALLQEFFRKKRGHVA
jgi:tRNA(adenine34) deaminase